jgi:hypothetical protein
MPLKEKIGTRIRRGRTDLIRVDPRAPSDPRTFTKLGLSAPDEFRIARGLEISTGDEVL